MNLPPLEFIQISDSQSEEAPAEHVWCLNVRAQTTNHLPPLLEPKCQKAFNIHFCANKRVQ